MRILVTGGAGFIGSHLALHLAAAGHRVSVVDNFDAYYDPTLKRRNAARLSKAGILVHQLDLAADPIEGIIEGVEVVYHLAAQPGNDANTPYASYLRNNMLATVALVETLKGRGIKLIHASTSSVYGLTATSSEAALPAPVSPYGVTKLGAEAAVAAAHRRGEVSSAIVRFFSVYGPYERPDKLFPRLFSALKHDTTFPLFAGSLAHQRSFSYVGDIVAGATLALTHFDRAAGEVINLGTDQVFTTAQAIAIAEKLTGKKLKVRELPARPGDQANTAAVIDKARKLLEYAPSTTLEQGLEKVWAWAQQEL